MRIAPTAVVGAVALAKVGAVTVAVGAAAVVAAAWAKTIQVNVDVGVTRA